MALLLVLYSVDAFYGLVGFKKNITIFMRVDSQNYTYIEPD